MKQALSMCYFYTVNTYTCNIMILLMIYGKYGVCRSKGWKVWTAGFDSICYYSSLDSTQVAIVNICSVGYGTASSLVILKKSRMTP